MEGHPQFAERIIKIIADAVLNGDKLSTSVITLAEFGVMPTRNGRHEAIKSFEALLESLNIEILVADRDVAVISYQLRAKYEFLKGMDALQLGISISQNCDAFITNDKKLKKIAEMKVILLDDE